MHLKNLDEVIARLDEIIEWSVSTNSRIGYFAALYKRMTQGVKKGIEKGVFENVARMEKLDVIFATRYLEAFENWQNKKPLSFCWHKTFEACNNKSITIIQHLLLGMSAHINLDLGIAAAKTAEGVDIALLKKDFDAINNLIGDLINEVQDELSAVNKTMHFIDKICNDKDEAVANFSIAIARKEAWRNAVALSTLSSAEFDTYNATTDSVITMLAGKIINPGWRTSILLNLIMLFEKKDIKKNIAVLNRQVV